MFNKISLTGKVLLLILAMNTSFLFAQDISEEGNKLLQEIDRNLTPQSFESLKKIINIEPNGTEKEFVLFVLKKGNDKMITTFLSPKSEVGRSTLRLDENMWLYIPNVGKPMRITSLQSVIGGIFNNSDIMQLDYTAEYDVIEMTNENNEILLNLKAKTTSVAYDKLKMWVNTKHKTPSKIECYTASGMLIKTLNFKEIKDFGNGIIRPSVLETDSPLHKDYKAVMIYASIKPRKIDDEVFTLNYMGKVKDLRK
ncbi:MAG: outer membrane lipoprotein-sorting protein [Candidatus Tenebribacter burtonii]|jgi:outer membrane lipoprotein-sorting protein|nr:outer membrane lipoprotein-sorting protein [Candidatus Tenebribacter burtonii]